MKICFKIFFAMILMCGVQLAQNIPGSAAEPIRYSGSLPDQTYSDGRLPQAIGVENIQVMRANRSHPELSDGFGWTYNHGPMLAYWNGLFFLEYLSTPVGEAVPPGQTFVVSSKDGRNWNKPVVAFPVYNNPDVIMHQRMGFYVSSNNRLLILGCYAVIPKPNDGRGIGRVVREIYKDGTMSPIYFIRIQMHNGWNESNVHYPLYTKSGDRGFIEACDSLLTNKLMTLQWFEEDQGKDGFFRVDPDKYKNKLKALSYYHRKDGRTIGLWKSSLAMISDDNGKTWSDAVKLPSIPPTTAKIWAQKTDDGNFAITLCPTTQKRYPLCISVSEDGINFGQFYTVHDEVPPKRFGGSSKNEGPQYVRGIAEGNGNPTGSDLWITYSVSKEDIWVARIPVPVRFYENENINDSFENPEDMLKWNLYKPLWAPVSLADSPVRNGKSLLLQDSDSYDFAKVSRTFSAAKKIKIDFSLLASQNNSGRLEIEILDANGRRAASVVLADDAKIKYYDGEILKEAGRYDSGEWMNFHFYADCAKGAFNLSLNGTDLITGAGFIESAETLQRLLIRTGEYRGKNPVIEKGRITDWPSPDDKIRNVKFYIDDVKSLSE
jgi:hypothetical protein